MENAHQDKRSWKLLGICKLLQTVYQELESYSKASQQTQRKERPEMGRRTPESIWRIKKQDNKSTGTCSSKERRKFLSGNKHLRTCNKGSFILETRRKMKTHCIFIQNNTTSRKELQDLQ